ncbi:ABC transporter ATP-binding protein [Streptomyces sp. WMMB 322]|uniref:ABC transporter ATP-binding protein n=1 Tax=Streptomyces sp. WMMB 322 TaxID=1286821 RepID=UPI000823D669|nr:oligopeptide/dipeptide ABC transporter ATP-binding protein [Streptomyces sp. WMMB 322]SCK26108.1 peptide/nickel transport system ATP-binding protein [Streptomyces sp. WMMB 322]
MRSEPSPQAAQETRPTPLLNVRNLCVRFPGPRSGRRRSWVHAAEDVSFAIQRGRTLGLVGESGSGKSTTGNALTGLVRPTSGTVHLDGQDVLAARGAQARELRRRIAMVFQDPYSSLDPRRTAGATVREPLDVHRMLPGRAERNRRVAELLDLVGLVPGTATRYPHELSGGQRQRVSIARALAADPDLIVLDESTAALDVSVQAQIMNLLRNLQGELGLTYLFISHDLAAVEHMSHRVVVMYLGRLMETGSTDDLYARPAHPYTQALMSAVPDADPTAEKHRERILLSGDPPSPLDPPSGCVFRTRCPLAADECAEPVPPVTLSDDHAAWCVRTDESLSPDRLRRLVH